jgi:hypothetical protein
MHPPSIQSWKNQLVNIQKFLIQNESLLFYLVCLVNLIPVLSAPFFPTVDGPAHLYNSFLIKTLIGDADSPLHQYLILNPNLSPNLIGHFLLTSFLIFMPAFLAEKAMVVLYFIALPLSFRLFLQAISPENAFLKYFIFPFTYGFLLFYGFFNFLFGVNFLFLFLSLYETPNRLGTSWKRTIQLTSLALLVWFSHLFVFGCLLLIMGILELHSLFSFKTKDNLPFLSRIRNHFLVFLLPIVLSIQYFISSPPADMSFALPDLSERLNMISDMQPVKAIRYGKESQWAGFLWILLSFTLLTGAISSFWKRNQVLPFLFNKWGLVCLSFLSLLLFFPDSLNASIAFISSRVVLLFFLFLFAWGLFLRYPLWVKTISLILVLAINAGLLNIYHKALQEESRIVLHIEEAAALIPPNSAVLPICQSNHWLHTQILDYVGKDKPLMLISNYEPSLPHFPLRWNYDQMPDLVFGRYQPMENCISWTTSAKRPSQNLDFVLILSGEGIRYPENCLKEISRQLQENYSPVYMSPDSALILYQLIPDFSAPKARFSLSAF